MLAIKDGQYTTIDGLKTFYFKVGNGHPVLLIHGASPGACTSTSWKLNIEALAEAGFTVYAHDQPGFGLTENAADHTIEYRLKHTKAFIEAMKLDRYHVVGNSVGGYIAARLALEDPRVGRFVTTTSGTLAPQGSPESQALAKQHAQELRGYTPSMEAMKKLTLGTIYHAGLVTDEMVKERYEMSLGKNHDAHIARHDLKPPRRIHDELRTLKKKSLLVWGNKDHGVTVERGLLLFEIIPQAEFHLFDECAHWVQWDQAARFNRLVADFLSEAR
jgi:pimeloyl-ACP methyl ester carboxylesterase